MKALAIIKQNEDGTPDVPQSFNWVHLGSNVLNNLYKAYKISSTEDVLDSLNNEVNCVVLLKFEDINEDGMVTYSELDISYPDLLNIFNNFMQEIGNNVYPEDTTTKEILESFGINQFEFDIYDE